LRVSIGRDLVAVMLAVEDHGDIGRAGRSELKECKTDMSRAINIIKQEHLNYLALLQCLDHLAAEASQSRAKPDLQLFHSIIDYIESFLNRFHHPKEDDYLFRALVERHPQCQALIQRLQGEHAEGDELLQDLKDALADCESGVESAWIRFADAVGRYREHQYNHMRSEEVEALPLAREHLTDEDWQEIDAAFCAHGDPLFGDDRSAEYRRLYSKIVAMAPAPYGFGDKDPR
jgi:branched-chain amino acid transport system ATP-binding protein